LSGSSKLDDADWRFKAEILWQARSSSNPLASVKDRIGRCMIEATGEAESPHLAARKTTLVSAGPPATTGIALAFAAAARATD